MNSSRVLNDKHPWNALRSLPPLLARRFRGNAWRNCVGRFRGNVSAETSPRKRSKHWSHRRGVNPARTRYGVVWELQCHEDVIDVAALQQELVFESAFDVVAVCEVEGLGSGVGAQDPEGNAAGLPSDCFVSGRGEEQVADAASLVIRGDGKAVDLLDVPA